MLKLPLTLYLSAPQPSLLFLQELFTPYSRHHTQTTLSSTYHQIHAVHKYPTPPLPSYLLTLGAGGIFGWIGALILNPYTILFISNVLLRPFLFPRVPVPDKNDTWSSFMGTATLFNREEFHSIKVRRSEVMGEAKRRLYLQHNS